MHDSGVVASIVADDADGLAEAYDRYADSLYKYCRSMLSEPADAADAVQDTFVIAAARLAGLREPDRLRAWLFAVARNEALRTLWARNAAPALAQAPDVTPGLAEAGDDAGRAGRAELLDGAAAGLNPGEREVIELQLRQGLEPAEVATVLGVSRNHVHSLLSRARDQLEACLAVLLVGRAGQADCATLASLLAGWDGRLTVPLRKQVHRHIERCATCGARRAAELRPAMLLGLSPGAAMAAAAAENLRAAAGPPGALKAHTLALAAGQGPGAAAHRAAVLGRAGSFDGHGFPKPVHGRAGSFDGHGFLKPVHSPARALAQNGGAGGRRSGRGGAAGGSGARGAGVRNVVRGRKGRAAAAAGVLLAVAVGALAFALSGNGGQARLADGKLPGAAPSPGASVSALAAPGKASATPKRPAARTAAAHTKAPRAATATDRPPAPAPPTADPTTPGAPQSPTRAPTTASPPAKPTTAPPPAGTLQVFPPGGQLFVPPWGTRIFLGAQGGAVTWSAAVSPGNGTVTVSPSGGTIAAGGRETITITASQSAGGRQVTLYPGGITFTITVNRGHHPFAPAVNAFRS